MPEGKQGLAGSLHYIGPGERVREFTKAGDVTLDAEDFALLKREFPPPKRKTVLAVV